MIRSFVNDIGNYIIESNDLCDLSFSGMIFLEKKNEYDGKNIIATLSWTFGWIDLYIKKPAQVKLTFEEKRHLWKIIQHAKQLKLSNLKLNEKPRI